MNDPYIDRSVLLTGAGGSIGSALANAIVEHRPRSLILLDHSECNLHQVEFALSALPGSEAHVSILGDICDAALLSEIFDEHAPEAVIHAAAFKHVPLMEFNPIAAVQNNALATNLLAQTAAMHGVSTFVMVSTDKAVNPHSVMGASKRLAELALLRWSSARSPMRAVRLGNVFASHGSVVPKFLQQIAAGGPVTVTHPDVTRYFLGMAEAVELLILAASLDGPGGIFVSDLGEPVRILDLAHQLIDNVGAKRKNEIPIVITGLRPGDKMSEEFLSNRETVAETNGARLRLVNTPQPPNEKFDAVMAELQDAVDRRDVTDLLDRLLRLVPEYRPTETILALRQNAASHPV
ncbi:MAG: polysaccharide biosynthesis protein [Candidatus Acidiferrales bacterium]|jgi:FlaA1/EpsC-like NDP-sugar epimerase